MSDPRSARDRAVPVDAHPRFPPFAGYPYLVTRIGRTALRHIILLPAGWPEARLVAAARHQQDMNAMETSLCVTATRAVFFDAEGRAIATDVMPTGIPLHDRLVPGDEIAPSPELEAREQRLRAYVAEHRPGGFVVGDGLDGGRPPTRADLERLEQQAGVTPPGLRRCVACDELAGEYLRNGAGGGPLVIDVRCRCANPNRCARCGDPLYARGLSTWFWDGSSHDGGVKYVPAFVGLSHRCRRRPDAVGAP